MPRSSRQKRRGRPPNPYTSQYWGEGWPYRYSDRFTVGPELAAVPAPPTEVPTHLGVYLAPLVPGESQVESAIRWILARSCGPDGTNPVPLVRTVIESTLRLVHYAPPRAVTEALRAICKRTTPPELRVYQTELVIPAQRDPTHVYSLGRLPTKVELQVLKQLSSRRQRDFDRHKSKRAELYVWELLFRTGRFKLHDKSKCGKIPTPIDNNIRANDSSSDDRKHFLDVLAIDRVSELRYGISVKNLREEIYGGHPAIKDAYTKATAHRAVPVLVAAHIGPEGWAACISRGVVPHNLGRQLLPKELPDGRHMEVIVRDLMAVLGPQIFEYLPKQLRWSEPPQRIVADLEFFQTLRPLEKNWANKVWSIGTQRAKPRRRKEPDLTDEPIATILLED